MTPVSLDEFCGRFHFAKDMNGDGVNTISDLWLKLDFIWRLPAKIFVSMFSSSPQSAAFWEIDCDTGESWGGALFSLVVWPLILGAGAALLAILSERFRPKKKPKK